MPDGNCEAEKAALEAAEEASREAWHAANIAFLTAMGVELGVAGGAIATAGCWTGGEAVSLGTATPACVGGTLAVAGGVVEFTATMLQWNEAEYAAKKAARRLAEAQDAYTHCENPPEDAESTDDAAEEDIYVWAPDEDDSAGTSETEDELISSLDSDAETDFSTCECEEGDSEDQIDYSSSESYENDELIWQYDTASAPRP